MNTKNKIIKKIEELLNTDKYSIYLKINLTIPTNFYELPINIPSGKTFMLYRNKQALNDAIYFNISRKIRAGQFSQDTYFMFLYYKKFIKYVILHTPLIYFYDYPKYYKKALYIRDEVKGTHKQKYIMLRKLFNKFKQERLLDTTKKVFIFFISICLQHNNLFNTTTTQDVFSLLTDNNLINVPQFTKYIINITPYRYLISDTGLNNNYYKIDKYYLVETK